MAFQLPVVASTVRAGRVAIERASARLVRVSLTDRCDMACVYCRPSRAEGYLAAEDRLDVDAWEAVLRGLYARGVRRVRLTGGEPLLFKDVVSMVRRIAALGFDDLAMTTHGAHLAPLAKTLREAGLRRLTISLDTLDPARFSAITRGGDFDAVIAGVEAARAAGFDELKTNTVVLRGENDESLEAMVRWAWARQITPRFIEVMGVGEGGKIWRDKLVSMAEQRRRLGHLLVDREATRDPDRGPAKYLFARDGSGARVGFISGSTDTYCGGCDRLRASSDGTLRPCLATADAVGFAAPLREAMREGDDTDAVIAEALDAAWAMKPDAQWQGCTEVSARGVSMRAIGG
ncbi:MAG: GTP 3',8-cyclase MoaA [Myxococcales bacterium]|nr:GTP 3',8-cyclase MoaA [Myxococcales bacterium]